jgi:putative endonuclease
MMDEASFAPTEQHYYVYLSQCANAELYVGSTHDVELRMLAHNQGKGGRYTRARRPLTLLASWSFNSRTEARHIERLIKRLTPLQKYALAEQAHLSSLHKMEDV